MAVPGCPLSAACGASMARPRMTLMARDEVGVSGHARATLVVEDHDSCGEAVQEAAPPDGPDLARAEHARDRSPYRRGTTEASHRGHRTGAYPARCR